MSLCLRCNEPLTGMQRKYCSETCKRMWYKEQAMLDGLCTDCQREETVNGTTRCEPCGEMNRERSKKLYEERKTKGLCPRCGSGEHEWCHSRDKHQERPMGW